MTRAREVVLSTLTFPTENYPAALYATGSEDLDIDLETSRMVGKEIGLGTWFNAAPIGWWSSLFGSGTLTLRLRGQGNLKVWGTSNGIRVLVSSVQISGRWSQAFALESKFEFLWVELCDAESAIVEAMEWTLSSPRIEASESTAKVTVVVPTFGLEQEALKQVQRLLAPSLSDVVARVLVIDQGNTVAGSSAYPEIAERFGSRFELIEQGNFGGSGGYARGMIESLRFPNDAVLLLDDDAVIEPASLRRAIVVSEALGRNTIIGTGLISAELPSQIASLAEGINRKTFHWGPTDGIGDGQELVGGTPENWTFLSSKSSVEYSGWWGTLLPAGAVEQIGFPAPFFLKWDDAEYGLRANKAGIQTTTIPGISAWHPTWAAKGTVSSWSSWPMHRNRLTVAAAYGATRGVIWHSFVHQVKHVLSLQYASAELWNKAIEQFLESPEWLTNGLIETRTVAQRYLDSLPQVDLELTPNTQSAKKSSLLQTLRAVYGLFAPASLNQVGFSKGIEYSWSKSIGMDGFVIERMGKTERLVRDPRRAREICKRSFLAHVQLYRKWKRMGKIYASELPTAAAEWESILGLAMK